MHAGTRSRNDVLRARTFVATLAAVAASGAIAPRTAVAALPSEVAAQTTTVTLPTPPSKHWVWINDMVFDHMADGLARLVDGDTGRYLGALSTGFAFSHVVPSRDGRLIYSAETYFARGTRGARTDVVTIYDAATLGVQAEVQIPPKREIGRASCRERVYGR